jgi:hypothetical protein
MIQKRSNPAADVAQRSAAEPINPEHTAFTSSNQALERIALALPGRLSIPLDVVRAHCRAAGVGREGSI